MSRRADQLHATADRQIADLIALVSTLDDRAKRQPCPGREKLGDGTIAASAQHTADNYRRITEFVRTGDRTSGAHPLSRHDGRNARRFLKALGHRPPDHTARDHGHGTDENPYAADNVDLPALRRQLSATRDAVQQISRLTEQQLDAIPPDGSFRFCDGKRTLEQVLASLLNHQSHQLDALNAARI